MDTPLARKVAGKKFMWDGAVYVTGDDARAAMEAYKQDGFETHLIREEDRFLVYSRRVVTAAKAEG